MDKKRGLLIVDKQLERLYSLAEIMKTIRKMQTNEYMDDGEQNGALQELMEETEELLEELGLLRERI